MMLTRIPRIVYYCLSSSVFSRYQRHHVTSSDSFFSIETLRVFCLFVNLKFYALRLAVLQTSYFLLVMNNPIFLRLNQFMQPCRQMMIYEICGQIAPVDDEKLLSWPQIGLRRVQIFPGQNNISTFGRQQDQMMRLFCKMMIPQSPRTFPNYF